MTQFPVHTAETAPAAAATFEAVQKKFGFVPNLIGVLADAPAAAEGYAAISGIFGSSSLSAVEQQLVLITTSIRNDCEYCVAAHSTVAQGVKMDAEVLSALRAGSTLPDSRLEALRQFTLAVVEGRGQVESAQLEAFLAAGFERSQLLEVVLGVTVKTLSNYADHLAKTPVDKVFEANAWKASSDLALSA